MHQTKTTNEFVIKQREKHKSSCRQGYTNIKS